MKRKLLSYLLSLAMVLLLPTMALAVEDTYTLNVNTNTTYVNEEAPARANNATYASLVDALNAAKTGDTIKLLSSVTGPNIVAVNKSVTIDLNGHSIERSVPDEGRDQAIFNAALAIGTDGTLSTVVLKDSSAGGTGKIVSTMTLTDARAASNLPAKNAGVYVMSGSSVTLQSGAIESKTTNAQATIGVWVQGGSTFTMTGGTITAGTETYLGNSYGVYVYGAEAKTNSEVSTFNMTGGTINAVAQVVLPNEDGTMSGPTGDAHGVHVDGNGASPAKGVFHMSGGTIDSKGFGISGLDADDAGNGRGVTDIDITNAEVIGYAAAIYHPQDGTLDITNSTLTGTTGLEAKGGTITITDGTFNSLSTTATAGRIYNDGTNEGPDEDHSNSTMGWAVAVVNNGSYKTKGVDLTINGGVYNAPVGVFDDYNATDNNNRSYKLTIKGGTFHKSVRMYGYDTEKFTSDDSNVKPKTIDKIDISGGTFQYAPTYHVAAGKVVVKDTSGYHTVVDAAKVTEVAAKDATCTAAGNVEYYEYKADESATPVACYLWSNAQDNQVYAWAPETVKPFYVYYTNDAYLISAVEHEWEKKSENAAGEEMEGSITYKCKNCTAENKVTLEPTGVHHDDSPTGTLTRHNKVEANCKTLTNGTEEYWTCSNAECEGKKFVKGADNTFVKVTDDELKIPYAHTVKKIEGHDAECAKTGLTEGTKCETCGVILKAQSVIPAKGHTPGKVERENETDATCTTDGSYEEIIKCSTCGEELSSTKIVVPAAHKLTHVDQVDSTTSATGMKEHYKCSVCSKLFSDSTGTTEVTEASLIIPKKSSGGSSSSGSSATYAVSVDTAKNGSVSVSPKNASKGTTVTVTTTPDKGWTLETLTVLDKNGKEVELTIVTAGEKYTFKMPSGKVTVSATFMEDNTMLNYFADVTASDYFYDAVLWAAENGITKGVDDLHFAPNNTCTRAQIVTFLWRAAGSPEPKSVSSFTDVASDSYYAKAVAWAVENGITNGTGDGVFSPDEVCTRAQSVTFLARALGGKAVASTSFSDVPADSWYAGAVAWAAENGVTEGIGGGLFGSGNNCTRGQIVTFLFRAYVK